MSLPSDSDVISQSALRQYVRDVSPEDYLARLLEPVFARPRYAEFFWRCATTVQGYAASVVLANGPAEAEGSEKLFALWQGVDYNRRAEEQILEHARDESRHSHLFVRLTERAFPRFLTPSAGARFEERLPDVRRRPLAKSDLTIPEDHLVDHLVQMNIGEIRTRLHMHLFAPIVFGLTPPDNRKAVRRILEGLYGISATGQLREGGASD